MLTALSSSIRKGAFLPPWRVRKLGPKQGRKPEYIPAGREGERTARRERCWTRPGERGAGLGPRACLPSISAPVDEIWLRDRLAVPTSSWQLLLVLERNVLQAEPLAQLQISPPRHAFRFPPSCSPVQDSELDVAGEARQLQRGEGSSECVPHTHKVQSY